ncbi:MAG: type II toxin-antitoxin system death-on-curing family toxin [bacterium]|nr:type II toxin-antitoxin system death-on-curing family toxin [bacterium]
MDYLSAEDILRLHSVVIDETGGNHGVRDRNAIASLEHLPKQEAFGRQLYPGLFQKAAVYVRNTIFSHPFIDGNKRTAMMASDVFLQLNGHEITIAKGGVEKFALAVIEKHLELEKIANWLKKNSKKT